MFSLHDNKLVKMPALCVIVDKFVVENIYYNWSGGCTLGSLGTGTAIEKIEYSNIHSWQSNQMMMIESIGGCGYVRGCKFTHFIGWSNAYALDINEAWSQRKLDPGKGVKLSNLTFAHWKGTMIDAERPNTYRFCSDKVPCTGINVDGVKIWTDSGASMKKESPPECLRNWELVKMLNWRGLYCYSHCESCSLTVYRGEDV